MIKPLLLSLGAALCATATSFAVGPISSAGVPLDSPSFTTRTTTTGAGNLSATNLFSAVSADGTSAVAIGQDTIRAAGSQTNQNISVVQKGSGNVVFGLGVLTYVDANGKLFANGLRIDGSDGGGNTIYNSGGDIGIVGSGVLGIHIKGTGGHVVFDGLKSETANAPTIASATTIAPTKTITFISGTTPIVTITAPTPISAGGGQITLIPTGIFTTTTGGNIALASTAVVNKALIMTYDATTTKWYPSY